MDLKRGKRLCKRAWLAGLDLEEYLAWHADQVRAGHEVPGAQDMPLEEIEALLADLRQSQAEGNSIRP